MAIDADDFREAFPEFANKTTYPTTQIDFWASIADTRLNVNRWGNLLVQGSYLFVAHYVSVSAQEKAAALAGVAAGAAAKVYSSESVGDVSANYDNQAMLEEKAGNYNLTFYGRELIRLARIVGIGGMQIT